MATGDELPDSGRRGEVMAGFRDYFLSRSLATVSNAGSIQDVAAMSQAQAQPRRTRGMPGQGQERDRGR